MFPVTMSKERFCSSSSCRLPFELLLTKLSSDKQPGLGADCFGATLPGTRLGLKCSQVQIRMPTTSSHLIQLWWRVRATCQGAPCQHPSETLRPHPCPTSPIRSCTAHIRDRSTAVLYTPAPPSQALGNVASATTSQTVHPAGGTLHRAALRCTAASDRRLSDEASAHDTREWGAPDENSAALWTERERRERERERRRQHVCLRQQNSREQESSRK